MAFVLSAEFLEVGQAAGGGRPSCSSIAQKNDNVVSTVTNAHTCCDKKTVHPLSDSVKKMSRKRQRGEGSKSVQTQRKSRTRKVTDPSTPISDNLTEKNKDRGCESLRKKSTQLLSATLLSSESAFGFYKKVSKARLQTMLSYRVTV